jgi:glyoxylase-like metal-dependent hydrolase (beta-lactamase superfamily II)
VFDPGFRPEKIIEFIKSNNLKLEYIIITHHHSDHSFGVNNIKKIYPKSKIISSKEDGEKTDSKIDLFVEDGDIIQIDEMKMYFILTPGHTPGSICIIINNEALITGDTLFIGDCGRTDLPGGDLYEMYNTLKNKIMKLPDHLIVYPGHDYGDKTFDKLGNQKKTNKTLTVKNFNDFSRIY